MTASWSSWLRSLVIATFLVAGTLAASSASAQQLANPNLEVPIPGLDLTPPSLENGTVTVGFVAEYVAGLYKFLISIVGIVAAVMIIYGGFLYLTAGGAADRVGKGRKRIVDALIGLVLAYGSYTILWVINPDLVEFQALQLTSVVPDLEASLGDTTADTAMLSDPERAAVTAATSPNGANEGGDGTGGSDTPGADNTSVAPYKYEWTTCPWEVTGTVKERDNLNSRVAFFKKVQSSGLLTGTKAQKVLKAANLADVCDAVLGSCGSTAGDISALAGVGKTECLQEDVLLAKEKARAEKIKNPKSRAAALARAEQVVRSGPGDCNDEAHGKEVFGLETKYHLARYALRCETEGFKGWKTCTQSGSWTGANNKTCGGTSCYCNRTDCIPATPGFEGKSKLDKAAAKAARLRFVTDLQSMSANDPKMKGYPDSVANQLLPGDRFNIYNGNDDLTGGHALVFLGWAKDKITAQTVDSSAGSATHYSSWWCVKEACIKKGKAFYPITKVWRP